MNNESYTPIIKTRRDIDTSHPTWGQQDTAAGEAAASSEGTELPAWESGDSTGSVPDPGPMPPAVDDTVGVSLPGQEPKRRSVCRFKFVYGWTDPVLWLAILLSVPSVGTIRDFISIPVVLILLLVIFSVVRYPIAIAVRLSRLSRNKPTENTTDTQWLPDPARLGTYRLWENGEWTPTVSGPAPRVGKTATVLTVAILGGLTALLTVGLIVNNGGSGGVGGSSVAQSNDPALAAVKADIRNVDTQFRTSNATTDSAIATGDVRAVQNALADLDTAMNTTATTVAALPPSVSADDKKELQTYVTTGQAAIDTQQEIIAGGISCGTRSSQALAEICIANLERTTSQREKETLTAWRTAILDLGYRYG
jgi:hypothetical protein